MTDSVAWQALECAQLREALVSRGFSDDGETLRGQVAWTSKAGPTTTAIRVCLGEAFPFGPPKVWLDETQPGEHDPVPTFHIEPDRSLCLWDREVVVEDAPWRCADGLLAKVAGWLHETETGWLHEQDTDLERYLAHAGRLVLYDADDLAGREGVLDLDRNTVSWREPVPAPALAQGRRKGRKRRGRRKVRVKRLCAYLLDASELSAPILTWADLRAVVGTRGLDAEKLVRAGVARLVLVRYTRNGRPGVLALDVRPRPGVPGGIAVLACESADATLKSRQLRAGTSAEQLVAKRVAVVGCGAVGSFVADLLFRSGVRRITLIDHQRLRPGNVVRHLAGNAAVGLNKADAVQRCLVATGLPAGQVRAQTEMVSTLRQALELLTTHDLVIDATADQRASALLMAGALDIDANLISVSLQREGGVVRVDRWPLLDHEHHAAELPSIPGEEAVRERGCGDSVSPTPPASVLSAATVATRTAIAVLTGKPTPASTVEVLHSQPDLRDGAIGILEPDR